MYLLITAAIFVSCLTVCVSGGIRRELTVPKYYGWVHAMLLSAVLTYFAAGGAFVVGLDPPTWLLAVSAVSWTIAAATILLNTTSPVWMKSVGVLILLTPPLLQIGFPGGIQQFVSRFDAFVYTAFYGTTPTAAPGRSETIVTPTLAFKSAFYFLTAFLVLYFYGRFWRVSVLKGSAEESKRSLHTEAIDQLILLLSIGAALVIAFLLCGGNGVSLGLFAGFIGAALTVALRELVQNFVSGLIMLWDKSIQVGDVIVMSGNRCGVVKKITLRYMMVQDRDDRCILVPHSQLMSANIENWTYGSPQVRLRLDIGIAYGSNLEKADEVMESIAYDVDRVLTNPLPKPFIISTDDSSIHYQLRFKIADPENGIANVMSAVYKALIPKLEDAGIRIPFPQREIRILNGEEDAAKGSEASRVGDVSLKDAAAHCTNREEARLASREAVGIAK